MIEEDSLVTYEISKDDVDHICRVCLQDGVLKSVFADDEVPKLSQKISECASVQVEQGDGLPENICEYCITELNLVYYFRNQCKASDAKLRSALFKNKRHEEIIADDLIKVANNNETSVPNHEQVPMTIEPIIETKTEPISETVVASPIPTVDNLPPVTLESENKETVVSITCTQPPEVTTNVEIPVKPLVKVEDEAKFLKNNVKNKIKCDHCDKTFLYYSKLKQHQISHSTERPFKCEICHKAFCRKDTLSIHMNTHTDVKPFKCDQCLANFKRRNSLNKHYYIHTNIKKYKCEICFKLFGRRDNYNVHMKSLHSGVKSFKCDLCPKAFGRSDVYTRHRKTHEQFTKKYICAICLKTYSRADVLRAHLKQHVKKFDSQP